MAEIRLSQLSAPRQALVRLCQSLDYGQILKLHIFNSEPQFHPPPTIVHDIKLDEPLGDRTELELPDFVVRQEVCRLLEQIDAIGNGCIDKIEVRGGLPKRLILQTTLSEAAR